MNRLDITLFIEAKVDYLHSTIYGLLYYSLSLPLYLCYLLTVLTD